MNTSTITALILALATAVVCLFSAYRRYKELYLEASSKLKQNQTTSSEYVSNSESTIQRLTEENQRLRSELEEKDYSGFDTTK